MTAVGKAFLPRDAKSRRFWALICLALFLTLEVFASIPALHRFIHSNADSPDHHCVITMLAQGRVSAADTAPVLAAICFVVIFCLPPSLLPVFSSFDHRLSPSRAPPQAR